MHVITKSSDEIIIKNKHRNRYLTIVFMAAIMAVAIYLDVTKDFFN